MCHMSVKDVVTDVRHQHGGKVYWGEVVKFKIYENMHAWNY